MRRSTFITPQPLIQVRALSKRFRSGGSVVEALSHISFEVEQGDIFGIIGRSGAGKSTLMRCLASLERPDAGEILIEGEDIVRMKGALLRPFRHKIGMIFQHFNLFSSRTVFGNVSYPLEVRGVTNPRRDLRVEEVLGLVGLQTNGGDFPARLSGGQKQRVGIARALAGAPHVLFCDEATSALDPQTTKEILVLLKMLNRKLGLTIVLITHEMEVIKQICNKVAVLEKGKIVEKGRVSHVFADPQQPTTKQFLQNTIHEVPAYFFKNPSPDKMLLRLSFKGGKGEEPVISHMVKCYDVVANILLGWLDSLEGLMVGNLVIELSGKQENLALALAYLQENSVHYEVLTQNLSQ